MIRLSQPIINEDCIDEISSILKSGMLVQGEFVGQFEKDIRNYADSPYALATSSGTASLHLALLALGIKQGDVVFLPAFTFPATANVVEIVGAETFLIDVDIDTYNIDTRKLEESIKDYKGDSKPKAIIVVHEFGAPCNMDEIMKIARKYDLYVIEDAACALGTKWNGKHVGTFGDIGCFSWHPRKAITTGEGGAITTANEELYKKILLLRNHGMERTEEGEVDFLLPGLNYRLTEFQAAMGIYQLKTFDEILEKRRKLAREYLNDLADIKSITLPTNIDGHSWQTFMIILSEQFNRKKVIEGMRRIGIETNLGAQALHMMSYFKDKYRYKKEDFPNAVLLYQQGLALPLHSKLSIEDIRFISICLQECLIK